MAMLLKWGHVIIACDCSTKHIQTPIPIMMHKGATHSYDRDPHDKSMRNDG